MKNTNNQSIKGIFLFLAFAILVSGSLVNAETLVAQDATFFESLKSLFSANQFTVVGVDTGASVSPSKVWNIEKGTNANTYPASSYCSSGHGLLDVYVGDYIPRFEFKDNANFVCGSTSGCIIELYCLDKDFCSGSSCGAGYSCVTKNAIDPYMPLVNSEGVAITSYNYCKASTACTGASKTCYRVGSSNTCEQSTYSCSYATYLDIISSNCASGAGSFIYSSLSSCQSHIQVVPTTSCSDGIKNQDETGIDCGGSCSVCSGNVEPTSDDLDITATIEELTISDSNGNALVPGTIQPGQTVKVSFKVRATAGEWQAAGKFMAAPIASVQGLCIPLVGTAGYCLTNDKDYLVEAGVIPYETAKAWQLPGLPTFSIWDNLFSVSTVSTDCCSAGMPNIKAVTARVNTGNVWVNGVKWVWNNLGDNPQVQSSDYIDIEQTIELRIPDSATVDKCPVAGQDPSIYWGGNDSAYVLYVAVKNGCFAQDGVITGYEKIVSKEILFDIDTSGGQTPGLKGDGESCQVNAQCSSGVCASSGGILGIGSSLKCKGSGSSNVTGNLSLVDLKKISLTKEEISTATSVELLASACKESVECVAQENYTASCISISKLRTDGVISDVSTTSFFSEAKKSINYGVGGATFGSIGGIVACAAAGGLISGGVLAVPAAVSCASAGALIGAGIGYTASQISFTEDDKLVKALEASDASAVGICTAEPTNAGINGFLTSIGNWWNFTGDAKTSGIIILIGGLFLFVLLFGALGGRK